MHARKLGGPKLRDCLPRAMEDSWSRRNVHNRRQSFARRDREQQSCGNVREAQREQNSREGTFVMCNGTEQLRGNVRGRDGGRNSREEIVLLDNNLVVASVTRPCLHVMISPTGFTKATHYSEFQLRLNLPVDWF